MRLNRGNYSFVVSHTTKRGAFIRRVEVPRKLIHTIAAGFSVFLLTVSLAAYFFAGTSGIGPLIAGWSSPANTDGEKLAVAYMDYSRPVSSFDFAQNAGGPFDGSFQLTAVDSPEEEKRIEKRLSLIEATSNPRFLPTIWAHLGKINNEFGFRRNPFGGRAYEFHGGMDIDGDRGDLIVAPANGIVSQAGYKGGYGYMVEIDHGNGLTTRYGHMSKVEVKEGDPIQRGQLLGYVGSTGRSTGPHLHYELRLDNKPINPRRFLPPEKPELDS